MRIFTPVGGEPSLMIGMPDFEDSTIFFITQAADIRADNMQILGDFVLRGEQIAKGRTKLGWCAIIDGNISIGYDKEPAALQEAILSGGYFFRQYGLIADGKYVKESSRWKYSSRRRALCLKDGQDFIVETLEAETFPRFSYVLEDLNVDAAIYLVGGDSYAYGRDGTAIRSRPVSSTRTLLWTIPVTYFGSIDFWGGCGKIKPGRGEFPCRPGRSL